MASQQTILQLKFIIRNNEEIHNSTQQSKKQEIVLNEEEYEVDEDWEDEYIPTDEEIDRAFEEHERWSDF